MLAQVQAASMAPATRLQVPLIWLLGPSSAPQIRQLNATFSPLLRLPLEIRTRIYECVLGLNFFHVSLWYPQRPGGTAGVSQSNSHPQWQFEYSGDLCRPLRPILSYNRCCAPTSEVEAYRRSQDPSLNEQLPEEVWPMQNCWRAGDQFHVDSCTTRHEECCMGRRKVRLHDFLGLDLLRACSQIYDEAKTLPFTTNVFGFHNARDMEAFHSRLNASQAALVRAIWYAWTVDTYTHPISGPRMFLPITAVHTEIPRFPDALIEDQLSFSIFPGLQILHISAGLADAETIGWKLPLRNNPTQEFTARLKVVRQLGLKCLTVIVSDEPGAFFGERGCCRAFRRGRKLYAFDDSGTVDAKRAAWATLRSQHCIPAVQKREIAESLQNFLAEKPTEPVLRRCFAVNPSRLRPHYKVYNSSAPAGFSSIPI